MELVEKVTDIINKGLSDLKYYNARGKVSLELANTIIPIIREEIKKELEDGMGEWHHVPEAGCECYCIYKLSW